MKNIISKMKYTHRFISEKFPRTCARTHNVHAWVYMGLIHSHTHTLTHEKCDENYVENNGDLYRPIA